ncbi:MAG: UvrD-helicase domain-containing protein, partial [Acidimicrobiales bacterium]
MSRPAALIDEEARRSIEEDLDSTLFVQAGAGSGKTTELVKRIVGLVATGRAKITGIAAITFTEAAAAELRIRVRECLEQTAQGKDQPTKYRQACSEALAHIDQAPISTIHGLCNRILAAHPIEAGLPPRFEVLEEVSESIGWQRRWSDELDSMARDPHMPQLLSVAFVLGVDEHRLEALARAVDYEWHLGRESHPDLPDVVQEVQQTASAGLVRLRACLGAAIKERSICTVPDDTLLACLERLAAHDQRLVAARSEIEALPLVVSEAPPSATRIGRANAWDGEIARVRELVAATAAERQDLIQQLVDLVAGALAHYFEARSHAAAESRVARGLLTFHDLLVLTAALLASEPLVLADVRHRYTHVLVDEFQDTDPLQLGIARLIGSTERAWEAGRCFFVGDPKQSIYRFRGADLQAYEAARHEIVGDGPTLLSSNFRSAPGIIDFVNACFAELLGERFQALDAARKLPGLTGEEGKEICKGAETLVHQVPVCMIGGEIPGKPTRREQRRIEAEDCAGVINQAVYEERWRVADPRSGELRPARLGDVAILVPRRTGLAELERALDSQAIGYRIESASLIFKSQEVRDILALARA